MNQSHTVRPFMAFFHQSQARTEEADNWRPEGSRDSSTKHSAPWDDRYSFTEEQRWAHCRRSLRATLITFAVGITLLALFIGLVVACVGLQP